ncbi:hypothetical protein EON63_15220 [archaeon]|nr:MAG: hypothetical protein EON63_15220 [archaeon]
MGTSTYLVWKSSLSHWLGVASSLVSCGDNIIIHIPTHIQDTYTFMLMLIHIHIHNHTPGLYLNYYDTYYLNGKLNFPKPVSPAVEELRRDSRERAMQNPIYNDDDKDKIIATMHEEH